MTTPIHDSGPRDSPFYRDAFSLLDVVGEYDSFFRLGLTDQEKCDLIQFLFGPAAPGSSRTHESPGDTNPITPDGWS